MRAFLLLVAATGTLLFGALLVLSVASPLTIERWARAAIEREVEVRVGGELHALDRTALIRRAQALIEKHKRESAFDRVLFAALHDQVERVVARMQDPDCECRRRLLKFIDETADQNIRGLAAANAHLASLIETRYAQVSQALVREVRVFSAANALVFVLLGLLASFRRSAGRPLLVPALVLLVGVSVTGYFYLFRQDWLQTILLGDYVGWWYFGYLGLVLAFLADIAMNKARVTATLAGGIASGLPPAC